MPAKVSNADLLNAGLSAMNACGKPMERIQTSSRSMQFRLTNGETVRVRTCNDHVLVVLADAPTPDAGLNIEGTDHLLIVMPETPRAEGPVIAYFLPTAVAVEAVRRTHAEWLKSAPATKGNNRTWNIWFEKGPAISGDFSEHWSGYRLPAASSPSGAEKQTGVLQRETKSRPLGEVIAEARRNIAEAAGVSLESVKISVALG